MENYISVERMKSFMQIKGETQILDFKEEFHFSKIKDKLELIKDIVSFANSKGGYLVFGVEDKNFEWAGLSDDSDEINDIQILSVVKKYTNIEIPFLVGKYTINEEEFYSIYIPPFTFRDKNSLIEFVKDGEYEKISKKGKITKKRVFRMYEIYGRVGTSNKPVNHDNQFLKWRNSENGIISNLSADSFPYAKYINREKVYNDFIYKLTKYKTNVIQIKGLGGIGKTSFIRNFCELVEENNVTEFEDYFDYIIWITGKMTQFQPSGSIKMIREDEISFEDIIEEFSGVFGFDNSQDILIVKQNILDTLENYNSLVIIDNMETINDPNIPNFIGEIPTNSKVVLTTRENLVEIVTPVVNIEGLEKFEFIDYFRQQMNHFGVKETDILYYLKEYCDELLELTYGSPIIINMIAYQLSKGSDIHILIEGLSDSNSDFTKLYENAMEFCFNEVFGKIDLLEKEILYVLSIPEKINKKFTIDDINFILNNYAKSSIHNAVMNLNMLSFVISNSNEYYSPSLVKVFSNMKLSGDDDLNTDKIGERYSLLNVKKSEWEDNLETYFDQVRAYTYDQRVVANKLKEIVDEYWIKKDYETTNLKLKNLLKESPDFARIYYERARINIDINADSEKIRSNYEHAVSKDPKNDFYWNNFASYEASLNTRKNRAKAIEYYKNSLEINPNNFRPHHGIAVNLTKLYSQKPNFISEQEIILEHFEKGYARVSGRQYSNQYAINAHAHALYLNNLGRFEEALNICDKGLEVMPNRIQLESLKGTVLSKLDPNYVGKTRIRNTKKGLFENASDDKMREIINLTKK